MPKAANARKSGRRTASDPRSANPKSKSQPSIEYLSTFAVALLLLAIVLAVVGLTLFTGKTTSAEQSTCYISAQLYCFQLTVANNGLGQGSTAYLVFTNNLGVPIQFASNAFVISASGSLQRYLGDCYPANALAGATVVCNATMKGYNPGIGSQIEPAFAIRYTQCSNSLCSNYNTSGSGIIYVAPKPTLYQVTLVTLPGGGSISINGQQYPSGSVIDFLDGAKYSLFSTGPSGSFPFEYWVTSGGASVSNTLTPSATASASSSGTIEAVFLCYQLTLNANQQSFGSESASPLSSGNCPNLYFIPNTQVSITATPASAYRIFESWTGSGSGSYTGTANPATISTNGNIIETANYDQCFFLTFETSGDGSESANPASSGGCPGGWYLQGSTVSITATNAPGYAFQSWTGTGTGSYTGTANPASITTGSNIVEAATFDQCFTLSLSSNPSGTGTESASPASSGGCPSGNYISGTSVSVSAVPASGYTFNSWSGSGTTSYSGTANPAPITIYSNIAQTANYAPCYTLSLNANPSGSGTESASPTSSGGCPTGSYIYGTQVTITGTAGSGYAFQSWTGSGTISYSGTADPATVTVESDIVETANYAVCYSLTLSQSGSGTGTESASPTSSGGCPSGSYTYISGTDVSISASASAGDVFQSWTGTGTGSYTGTANPATITVDSNIAETANYAACYQLSFYTSGSGTESASPTSSGGCPSGSYTYVPGTDASITASPSAGWFFNSWSGSGTTSYTGTANPAPITVDGGISETAYFYSTSTSTTIASSTSTTSVSGTVQCSGCPGSGFAQLETYWTCPASVGCGTITSQGTCTCGDGSVVACSQPGTSCGGGSTTSSTSTASSTSTTSSTTKATTSTGGGNGACEPSCSDCTVSPGFCESGISNGECPSGYVQCIASTGYNDGESGDSCTWNGASVDC